MDHLQDRRVSEDVFFIEGGSIRIGLIAFKGFSTVVEKYLELTLTDSGDEAVALTVETMLVVFMLWLVEGGFFRYFSGFQL